MVCMNSCFCLPLSSGAILFALFDVFVSSPPIWAAISYFFVTNLFAKFAKKVINDYGQVALAHKDKSMQFPNLANILRRLLKFNKGFHLPMILLIIFEVIKLFACYGLMIAAVKHQPMLIYTWVAFNFLSICIACFVIWEPYSHNLPNLGFYTAILYSIIIAVRVFGMFAMISFAMNEPDEDEDYDSDEDD